jgi:hypothetical protein
VEPSTERAFLIRVLLVIAGILIVVGAGGFAALLVFGQIWAAVTCFFLGCAFGVVVVCLAAFVNSPEGDLNFEITKDLIRGHISKRKEAAESETQIQAGLAGFKPLEVPPAIAVPGIENVEDAGASSSDPAPEI